MKSNPFVLRSTNLALWTAGLLLACSDPAQNATSKAHATKGGHETSDPQKIADAAAGNRDPGATPSTKAGNAGASDAGATQPDDRAAPNDTAPAPSSPASAPNDTDAATEPSQVNTPTGPLDASCRLPDAAFCDAFTDKSPGGRGGDLDDSKWSVSRLGFGCAYSFALPETPLNLCGVWKTVKPGGPDSQFCTNEDDEPRWTEGFDDNTDFNYLSARIRQPFDFEGRTGTVQWSADARTGGSHAWWTEMWLTDEAVPGPNLHNPDQLVTSKTAISVVFDLNCGVSASGLGTAGAGLVGVGRIIQIKDYAWTDVYDPFSGPQANARCVKTEQNAMNTFQVRINSGRVEVWASNAGEDELQRIAEADVDVGFSRGYVNVSHVHYNAAKAEVSSFQSYQWARIAFDGPKLPVPRSYEIADPLTPYASTCHDNAEVYRIAYGVTDDVVFGIGTGPDSPVALKFTDVDPSNAIGARLNFNTTYVTNGDVLRYRLNGKTWQEYVVPELNTNWARQGFSVPVPVEDLVSGENSVDFGTNSNPGFSVPANSMQIANIDLEIEVQ